MGKARDTRSARVSLRVTQGAVGETSDSRGNMIARESGEDG